MLLLMDTALLVHGFAGTAGSWDAVSALLDRKRYRPLAVDLRGHGQTAGASPISFDLCISDLLAAAPQRFTLVGYSMGGRIALQLALAAPERVERLVLVSTTAGISDAADRELRLERDLALASEIETSSIAEFADSWLAGPLFCGDRAEVNAAARSEIEKNTPVGLARALRGLSVGLMEPVWARLGEVDMPTTVIAGEHDRQYVALAEQLSQSIQSSQLMIIPAAGHAIPRNAPGELAALLSAV